MAGTTTRGKGSSKEETREALISAALAEFSERGLDVPSLDAICARAGFTRGAFYVHFRDREQLLEAVMEKVFGVFLDAVIATGDSASDLIETISRFAAAASTGGGDKPMRPLALAIDMHRVFDACARSPVLKQRFVSLLAEGAARVAAAVERGQRAGSVRADVHPAALGELLAMLALGILTALDNGVAVDPEQARETTLRLLAAWPQRD